MEESKAPAKYKSKGSIGNMKPGTAQEKHGRRIAVLWLWTINTNQTEKSLQEKETPEQKEEREKSGKTAVEIFATRFYKLLDKFTSEKEFSRLLKPVYNSRKKDLSVERDVHDCSNEYAIEIGPQKLHVHAHMITRLEITAGTRFQVHYARAHIWWAKRLGWHPMLKVILSRDTRYTLQQYLAKNNVSNVIPASKEQSQDVPESQPKEQEQPSTVASKEPAPEPQNPPS